ncbi:MAG: DUF1800 domain-containing protein [Sedimentisphaerales bacterium]|nr:DUF1800 domain-containing protein [Sedimentisphaerales bacterium]
MSTENLKESEPVEPGSLTFAAVTRPIDPAWAWVPYQPDAQHPWSLAQAGHLYRRAAFGANWDQLQQALADGPQKTIDRLLKPQADVPAFNRAEDQFDDSAAGSDSADSLRAWWLRRMIHTPHPLLEKMTLFWHNYFAVSNDRVKNGKLMQQHVALLREHALGSFRPLLKAIVHDPAVLLSAGNASSRKANPNDGLPRILLEEYTLGSKQCDEKDIAEAARAFTGQFVLRGALQSIPREHDDGRKLILGQEGNFTGDDVVQIALDHPKTPRRLVRKLYEWFLSETESPCEALVEPLVASLGPSYDVMKLVETILRSNLFFSSIAYRQRIKSPVEFALGMIHALEAMVSTTQLAQDLSGLGQNLYHPPTIKGWTGGRHWINTASLAGRNNLAVALLQGSGAYGGSINPQRLSLNHQRSTVQSATQFMLDLFIQNDLPTTVRDGLLDGLPDTSSTVKTDFDAIVRQSALSIVTLAEYHLA